MNGEHLQNGPPTVNLEVGQLKWFHPNLNRHQAEALLMQNGCDGSYLLRQSTSQQAEYSLSCRCSDSVKHFQIGWDGNNYSFGMGKFSTIQAFISHFENKPLIGGESGILTLLKNPYPRDIEEPGDYETVHVHAEWGKQSVKSNTIVPTSINSKEGYLTKQGKIVKNWKVRWFVLRKNELKYYKSKGEQIPIRTLDLDKCLSIVDDVDMGKQYSFGIQMPDRTFNIHASTTSEKEEWINLLKWKLGKLTNQHSGSED